MEKECKFKNFKKSLLNFTFTDSKIIKKANNTFKIEFYIKKPKINNIIFHYNFIYSIFSD